MNLMTKLLVKGKSSHATSYGENGSLPKQTVKLREDFDMTLKRNRGLTKAFSLANLFCFVLIRWI